MAANGSVVSSSDLDDLQETGNLYFLRLTKLGAGEGAVVTLVAGAFF